MENKDGDVCVGSQLVPFLSTLRLPPYPLVLHLFVLSSGTRPPLHQVFTFPFDSFLLLSKLIISTLYILNDL